MDNFIDTQKRRICSQLSSKLIDFISLVDTYVQIFEVKDFYTFSSEKVRNNLYKNEYRKFILNTTDQIGEISIYIAKISSLLISADRDMDSLSADSLKDIFESYLLLESALGDYKKETERMLTQQKVSISSLLNGAKKIKLHIEALLEKVSKTEA